MASIVATMFGRDLRQLFDGWGVVGLTEAQLIDRIARRDESAELAFEAILRRHGPAVLACCRRVLGDTSAAEDAFQATFLVLYRRAGSIRVGESLAPWLLHVARMAALKARQGELRRLARERRVARPELTAGEAPFQGSDPFFGLARTPACSFLDSKPRTGFAPSIGIGCYSATAPKTAPRTTRTQAPSDENRQSAISS
jgi:Sigma-70 region 2